MSATDSWDLTGGKQTRGCVLCGAGEGPPGKTSVSEREQQDETWRSRPATQRPREPADPIAAAPREGSQTGAGAGPFTPRLAGHWTWTPPQEALEELAHLQLPPNRPTGRRLVGTGR